MIRVKRPTISASISTGLGIERGRGIGQERQSDKGKGTTIPTGYKIH